MKMSVTMTVAVAMAVAMTMRSWHEEMKLTICWWHTVTVAWP